MHTLTIEEITAIYRGMRSHKSCIDCGATLSRNATALGLDICIRCLTQDGVVKGASNGNEHEE